MSVIPQSFNQGTGFVGSVSTGGTIPSEIDDLIVTNSLTSLGTTTLEGPTVINSTLDVSGDVTVNNVTVNGFLTAPNLAIEAVEKSDNTAFSVLFYDPVNKKVCVADATLSSFTYNPSNNTLTLGSSTTITGTSVNSGLIQGTFILGQDITATFQVITPAIGQSIANEFNLPTSLPTTVGQVIAVTNLTGVNNRPDTEWRTATAGSLIALPKSTNFDYVVPFIDPVTGDVFKDSNPAHFTYNPGRGGVLYTEELETSNLEVSSLAVRINSLQATVTGTNYAIVGWDFANVPRALKVDSALFYYNKTTDTLKVPNVSTESVTFDTGRIFNQSANVYLGFRGQYTTNFDFHLAFWDNGHVRYQTSEFGGGHRFYVKDTTLNTPPEQIFQIDKGNVRAYKPLRVEDQAVFVNPAGNDATMLMDTSANNFGLFSNSNDGYVFRIANVWKLRIYSNTVQVYDNLQVNGSATIDGDITKNTATLSSVNRNQNVLFHDNDANDKRIKENNAFYFNPANEHLFVTDFTANNEIYYKGQTLDQRFSQSGGTLPFGYTTVFSTRGTSTASPGWRMNDVVYPVQPNPSGRLFGLNNEVEWPLTASSNAAPTISQYGADITDPTLNTTSAINFQVTTSNTHARYFSIVNNNYAGWWNIRVSLVFQNNVSNNIVPYIRLRTGGTPSGQAPGATTERPATSKGLENIKDTGGSLSNLVAEGPVYLDTTFKKVYISTLYERGSSSIPPGWGDHATASQFYGDSINISCTFLGDNNNNETVNVLP